MKHSYRYLSLAIVAVLSLQIAASAAIHTREIDREFNAADYEKLAAKVAKGQIIAVASNDSVIRIEIDLETKVGSASEAEELFDKTEIIFDESGKDLSLVIKKLPKKGFFSIFSRNRNRVTATVNIIVPKNYDVNLHTGSGSIQADGLMGKIVLDTGSGSIQGTNLTGEIFADTGSGGIKLINVDGNIVADTGSGSIRIVDMKGELVADTGSGNVDASGDIHRFRIDTGSGSVKVQSLVELGDRSVADTGSGGINIQLPSSSGFNLDADVGSGHIDCGFPTTNIQQGKSSLKAVANNGGPLVLLDTGSGSISVQPNP